MANHGESHLEEILGTVTAEDEKAFRAHIAYRSQSNLLRMKTEDFHGIHGGTDALFNDIYQKTFQEASDNNTREKTDDKSVANTLETAVIGALKAIKRTHETYLWKNYEAMKLDGSFKSESERAQYLLNLAHEIGANDDDVQKLSASLRSGDELLWNQGMREFTDNMKERILDYHVGKHGIAATHEREHKFKAWYVDREMRDKLGVEPEDLALQLSPNVTYSSMIRNVERGLPADRNDLGMKSAGLKAYHAKGPAKQHAPANG